MNRKKWSFLASIAWIVGLLFATTLPVYSQNSYDGIGVVEAIPGGVRKQCLSNFISNENAIDWWIARPNTLDVNSEAADRAYKKIGCAYDLNSPTGETTFTCVGLVEWAYYKSDLDLTSHSDETDGCWPFFFPDEQFASRHLVRFNKPASSDIQKGDIVYRTTRCFWILPNLLIPGAQDHVGIIYKIKSSSTMTSQQALLDTCYEYDFQCDIEDCRDQVDNDRDGFIDERHGDCGGPTIAILQDSLTLVDHGQTQAYIPFSICNTDPCAPNYGYNIKSKGHVGPAINTTGTVAVPGGTCKDVYGIIDAGGSSVCALDTLTIIAWGGVPVMYDTCVQIIHVVSSEAVPLFTVRVVTILVLALILVAAVFMRRRAVSAA